MFKQVFAWTSKWQMQLLSNRDLHLMQRTEIDISLKRILKSSTTELSIKAFQKSDTSTFYSLFTLPKKSGWPNKAKWFLLKGLNDLDPAHFSHIDCYLINFTEKSIFFSSKINEEKLKKNFKRQRTILFGSSSIIWVHFILLTSIRIFKKYLILSYFSIYAN